MGGEATPQHGALVHLDAASVELDGPLQRLATDGDPAELQRVAEQEQVAGDRVTQECRSQGRRRGEMGVLVAHRAADRVLHRQRREVEVCVGGEVGGRRHVVVDDGGGARRQLRQVLEAGGHDDVAPQHEVGARHADARGVELLGIVGDAHVARDRAVLLCESGDVELRAALAVEMGRHAEDGADGDDPRFPPMPVSSTSKGSWVSATAGSGSEAKSSLPPGSAFTARNGAQPATDHRHEAGGSSP